jgi:hypothetical protein
MVTRRNWGIKNLSPEDEAEYMSELMLKRHTAEMLKCMDDPYYFYTTYCQLNENSAVGILSKEEFNLVFKKVEDD